MQSVSVIGLGKLGLPLAASFAAKKIIVYALDNDANLLNKLKNGLYNYYEPYLNEYLKQSSDFINYTKNYKELIKKTDVTFIVVPTPSKKSGDFSIKYILDVCKKIALELKNKNRWHLVTITSTLSPFSMDKIIKPYLEKITKKKCGKDFGLCYSPEFIALGSVINNLTNPDFILIGQSDQKSGNLLKDLKTRIYKNNPTTIQTNFINAEIIKLALNSYITTKISFANMIARLCENIPHTDVDTITSTIGLDSRIGNKFLKGAIPYGGPCFPRDNLALNAFVKSLRLPIKVDLPRIIDRFNRNQIDYLVKFIFKKISKQKKICVLGFTYKPKTNVIDESFSLKLLREILKKPKVSISIYDPAIDFINKKELPKKVKIIKSLDSAIKNNVVLIFTSPDNVYLKIKNLKDKIIIDCWRIFKNNKNKDFFLKNKYIALGVYND